MKEKKVFQVYKVSKDGKETIQTLEIKKGQKVDEFASISQIRFLLKDKPGTYKIKEEFYLEVLKD